MTKERNKSSVFNLVETEPVMRNCQCCGKPTETLWCSSIDCRAMHDLMEAGPASMPGIIDGRSLAWAKRAAELHKKLATYPDAVRQALVNIDVVDDVIHVLDTVLPAVAPKKHLVKAKAKEKEFGSEFCDKCGREFRKIADSQVRCLECISSWDEAKCEHCGKPVRAGIKSCKPCLDKKRKAARETKKQKEKSSQKPPESKVNPVQQEEDKPMTSEKNDKHPCKRCSADLGKVPKQRKYCDDCKKEIALEASRDYARKKQAAKKAGAGKTPAPKAPKKKKPKPAATPDRKNDGTNPPNIPVAAQAKQETKQETKQMSAMDLLSIGMMGDIEIVVKNRERAEKLSALFLEISKKPEGVLPIAIHISTKR